ncbi:6-pyruvoyltetrahydropterin synthase [Dictyostelium purpureum]|uniref:6-pyruvoyl tetrahydrobiopterin synthase n=1 Tax=Dictyostelium purpureum TaxID=5786 RepID=F0ZJL9_DICPU|nr:6-pyruvoyltetrahydropterin synthase [Dictyostelium purpureum]EGC35870.1 6-pyruvoyltetrahydropterin synthase [Dictyostelium purpureum]|eukprot:XP_003287601.1 6-pyruvoyltetrahydropterin synthase [Dictyostelium purpureum]
MPRQVILTRREVFSSSHRLFSDSLSLEENKKVYGKCINSHGHNYTLEVSVKGEVNPDIGMFMNITELKEVIKTEVMDKLDHKNLEEDVPELKGIVTTTENLSIFIWDQLYKHLKNFLYEVRILETENNFVVYRGE